VDRSSRSTRGKKLRKMKRFEFNQDKATKVQLQASEREGDIFGV